ncbi:hemolysin family protein [Planococcus sp. N028]|uniref:Hemolysin family protein n=1 Tax=Planococcus shixiaomingii TaxID=3058393 RepID=A0ABT8N2P2_9BACL|nr:MULTISPECIES: hemolysin family protein [unclassified Planococcus (in: firmicutes)]MDN7242160.1 hemolysin family protein [Planococcus sp. N028]WKA54433.1 hemolysin family protein [Planococcus sp. N022]
MDIITILNLALLVILIGLTAFFVGSEFAVVKIRMSRLDQLISEGNKKAIMAKKVASNLDYYLSACQLGITVTALGLGALGKPTVERLMYPIFEFFAVSDAVASASSYAIAFLLVTYLHVVVGEMAPKTLAIEYAEKMSLLLAPPLYWFGQIMKPFIWALNGAARVFLKAFGVQPAGQEQAYSEDELKIVMAQSFEGGALNETELSYMENVFTFDERAAKDIMVPRTELITLDKDMPLEEIIQVLDENNYTRYPVTEDGDKDKIIGFVSAKKMLPHIVAGRPGKLEDFVRELPTVFEMTGLQNALLKMQHARVHIAVVADEYGGTAGMITLEDILEEIVGEIRDEFDWDEQPEISQISDNQYLINGRVLLKDLEERFGLTFEESEDIDTIGGWVHYKSPGEIQTGDTLTKENTLWTVMEMDHQQIKQVMFHQEPKQ